MRMVSVTHVLLLAATDLNVSDRLHFLVENSMKFLCCLIQFSRRLATTLQRENALFILNTSANILYASNRYTPNQDTYTDEVLNESVHCS